MKSPFVSGLIGVTRIEVIVVPNLTDSLKSPGPPRDTIAPPAHPGETVIVGAARVPFTLPQTCASERTPRSTRKRESMRAFFMRASYKARVPQSAQRPLQLPQQLLRLLHLLEQRRVAARRHQRRPRVALERLRQLVDVAGQASLLRLLRRGDGVEHALEALALHELLL